MKSASKAVKASVVIPVFNDSKNLARCLEALGNSLFRDFEVIVADDCSSDDSAGTAKSFGCKVIRLEEHSGPAIARNKGADIASGEYLLFMDSDVMCGRETVSELIGSLDKGWDASVGAYERISEHADFFSMYKNIFIWNYHDFCGGQIDWFWTACGAVKKNVFKSLGGFSSFFRWKSVEDIELGYRMSKNKYKIFLNKNAVVKHSHRFGFKNILSNDFRKGRDWTFLNLAENRCFSLKHPSAQFKYRGRGVILSLVCIAVALSAAVCPRFLLVSVFVFFTQPLAEKRLFYSLRRYGGVKMFIGALFFKVIDDFIIAMGVFSGVMNFYLKRGKCRIS